MSDAATLMPEVTVGGHTLRPWGLRQMAAIGRPIADILANADEVGFNLGALFDAKDSELDKLLLKDTKLARLIALSLYPLLDIIQITLKVSDDELDKIQPGDAVKIVIEGIKLNASQLKKSFAPLAPQGDSGTGAAT